MSNVKFKLNYGGVRELLNSSEVKSMLQSYGQAVYGRTDGNGYELREGSSGQRAKVTIAATSIRAKKDNLKNNTLLKALGGGA